MFSNDSKKIVTEGNGTICTWTRTTQSFSKVVERGAPTSGATTTTTATGDKKISTSALWCRKKKETRVTIPVNTAHFSIFRQCYRLAYQYLK
jgi:hypothetical protein